MTGKARKLAALLGL